MMFVLFLINESMQLAQRLIQEISPEGAGLAWRNLQLFISVLGGSLALWRYRVLERRANKEKSGE